MKKRIQLLNWMAGVSVASFCAMAGTSFGQVVVDNDDGASAYSENGSWATSGSAGYNGGTYRYATSGGSNDATWTTSISTAGTYKVEVIYRAGANRVSSASYSLSTTTGPETVTVDQTLNDLTWVDMGTYHFSEGTNTVTLDASASTPSGSVVIADAVRFTQQLDDPEMRLAVVTIYDDIDSTTDIQNMIDDIVDLNYNAVTVHARFRGDATYFPNKTDSTYSNNEPRRSNLGTLDVLDEFTTRGHDAGLKVYAYVCAFLVTDGSDVPTDNDHVINEHPEWRTYVRSYTNTPVVQTVSHDEEGLWLDPAIPEVRQDVVNICGDIMMNYDCDGIILDRIRYSQTYWDRQQEDYGYHPDAIDLFNAQYSKSGYPAYADSDWISFRQDQVTALIQEVYGEILSIDSDHELYTFPIGRYSDALNLNYANWPDWLGRGNCDGAIPMIYRTSTTDFETNVQQHTAAYSGSRLLCSAIKCWDSAANVAAQIQVVRDEGMDGCAMFRHANLATNGFIDDIESKWLNTAPWPTMSWKTASADTTAPSTPNGLSASLTSGVVTLSWTANSESDLDGYVVYRKEGSGSYVKLNRAPVNSYTDSTIEENTEYSYVVTAIDYAPTPNESSTSSAVTVGDTSIVIVDNDDGSPAYTETGLWATSGATGYDGGTYRYATVGTAKTATWTAYLSQSGTYDIYTWYVAGANRPTGALYEVSASGGTQTAYVNQTQNSQTWVKIGTYQFNSGNNTVTLDVENSTVSGTAIADAIKFEFVSSATPTPTATPSPTPTATPTPTPTPTPSPTPVTEVILDNDDGASVYSENGSWSTSGATGYDGGTYRFAYTGNSSTNATWDLDVPASDTWTVEVMYRSGTNRASSTSYQVVTSSGTQTVTINQQNNSLQWVSLGSFHFNAGSGTLTLNATNSTGGDVVIADAVRLSR